MMFDDAEVFEGSDVTAALNMAGLDCERCGRDERLAAFVRFRTLPIAIGICAACYREMKALSRGEVV